MIVCVRSCSAEISNPYSLPTAHSICPRSAVYFSSLTRTLPPVICLFRTVPHRLHQGSPLNFRFEEQCNAFRFRTPRLFNVSRFKIGEVVKNCQRPSSILSLHSYYHLLWPSSSECQSFGGGRKQ